MLKLHLTPRLICGVVIIQALTLGLLLWNGARLLGTSQDQSAQRAARDSSTLMAAALAPPLAAGDRTALLGTLELVKDNRALRYAGVVNPQGERVAALGEPPDPAQDFTGELRYSHRTADGAIAIERPIVMAGRRLGLLQIGYATATGADLIRQAWVQGALIALTGLLLSAVPIGVAGAAVNRSLRHLESGVRALEQGELERRIEVAAAQPVAALAGAINALGARLQARRGELRSQLERLLQESRRLNALLHGVKAVVWEVDPKTGQFHYVSDAVERLAGYPAEEWLKPDFCRLHLHPSDADWVQGFLNHPGTGNDSFTLDFRLFSSQGECLWLRMISYVEVREQGPALVGLLLNVTEEKRSEQRIAFLANHDPLTGLINRRRFQERLEEQIAYNRRYHTSGALLFMDLDQFKYINDSYGHHTGDEYLRQVAHHLRRALRKTDIIGRLGGDEFGVILPNVDSASAGKVADTVLKSLNAREFIHEGRRSPFCASIGIALFPAHGDKAGVLLARADSAMYSAKDQGRNTYRVFEEGIDAARMQEKIAWEERIRRALKEDRFQLYFQPIVDIESGVIRHYESLLRMIGEQGEVIGPAAFIGIAERFGTIREIDRWVVEHAIKIQGTSCQVGRPVSLTINLSGRHFGSHEMLEIIQETTRRYKADPGHIVFEVTETAAVENFTEACDFIQALRDMGYRFALDDFGAGFSSFDYIKHIPVDYIKIDGSFVRNLNRDRIDQIFVNAIAEMARDLGVQAIAECVENQEIVDILKKLGVPLGQGYYFARPAPRFHEHGRVIVGSSAGPQGERQ